MDDLNLASRWELKQRDGTRDLAADFQSAEGWLPAEVPGTVQQDLLRAGRIPDPFWGMNENEVQWVGETDWLYRCTFDVPDSYFKAEKLALCFDGLDTIASVWLNGQRILDSDNMFVPARVQVRHSLKPAGNVLNILFESAPKRGRDLEAQYGKRAGWNTETSRVYVRKAQYHYGWDWGPILVTAGLWRPVGLEAYEARIEEINAPASVSADLTAATIPVAVHIENFAKANQVRLSLYDPAGQKLDNVSLAVESPRVEHAFQVAAPQLWYPNGYGAQPRYRLVVELLDGHGQVLDSDEQRLGLRRLRVVQEPLKDAPGTSFVFEVNNIPVFCGGANWIPADSMTPRVSAEKYRAWIQRTAEANMVMLRVWGGGIYEEDVFYDLCDEYGILVWQDFMFACGFYPAHDEFLANVRAEAEANVRRLRHHPSMAIWCGNNEDYQMAESLNVYDDQAAGPYADSAFPGREIYERLLPEVCAALDPTRLYWPGSPYGGKTVFDQTIGDRHTWEIWHGNKADYHDYPQYAGRFVSEFGMQAAPDRVMIESFTRPEERTVNSPVLVHHNKSVDGPQRLEHYLNLNVVPPTDLDGYIYTTQFIQSEAVAAAVNGWRRAWKGQGAYETAGALVWQINDCWPVTSWALMDYELRAKPAYYRIRRCFAPLALSFSVDKEPQALALWAASASLTPIRATLDIQVWGFDGSLIRSEQRAVNIAPNGVTEFGDQPKHVKGSAPFVVSARLLDGDKVLARAVRWPEPAKSAAYPDPGLEISPVNEHTVRIAVKRPARGVVLSAGDRLLWTDNMLDLIPGDPQIVGAEGLTPAHVTATWYGR